MKRCAMGAWAVAAAMSLVGCGGGGSAALTQPDDGYAYPPAPATGRTRAGTVIAYPDPPATLPSGPAYDANPSLDLTRYRYAHAVGAQGQGTVVAVVDSGVGAHPQLNGAVLPGVDVTGDVRPGYANDGRVDVGGHGTAVAGLISARAGESAPTMIGVAPKSQVLPVRVSTADDNDGVDPRVIARGLRLALDRTVLIDGHSVAPRIVNLSMGAAVPSPGASEITQVVRERGALLVAAAGNDGRPNPDWPAADAASAGGYVIAVGAVDANGVMPEWSNRAGVAKDYYLVAPGVALLTTVPPNLLPPSAQGFAYAGGTSFSTPVVSGAAAVVWGLWPYLTAPEVSGILLDTARDLGAPGTDEVYGRGLLDLQAALQPVGAVTLPTASGQMRAAALAADSKLAAALRRQQQPVMVFDRYRRHFAVPLGQLVADAAPRPQLAVPVEPRLQMAAGASDGVSAHRAWLADAQGRQHWQAAWRVRHGDTAWTAWTGYAGLPLGALHDGLNWLPGWAQAAQGVVRLDSLTQGIGWDRRGGSWTWGWAQTRARTAWGGVYGEQRLALHTTLGPWRVGGHTAVSDRPWWQDASGPTTQWGLTIERETPQGTWGFAWSAARTRQTIAAWDGSLRLRLQGVALGWHVSDTWFAGDRLAVALSRPLAVRRGQVALSLPTAVDTTTGAPRFSTVPLSLRQQAPWRLEAAWSAPLRRGATLTAAAVWPLSGQGAEVVLRYRRPF